MFPRRICWKIACPSHLALSTLTIMTCSCMLMSAGVVYWSPTEWLDSISTLQYLFMYLPLSWLTYLCLASSTWLLIRLLTYLVMYPFTFLLEGQDSSQCIISSSKFRHPCFTKQRCFLQLNGLWIYLQPPTQPKQNDVDQGQRIAPHGMQHTHLIYIQNTSFVIITKLFFWAKRGWKELVFRMFI